MRLTCPNCDAQYEVPDEVMPTSGRDVQCSNCGQTWFQNHPDHAPDDDNGLQTYSDVDPDPDEEVSPPPPPPPPADEPRERRRLDPAVADILRQEAEAEHAARQREKTNTLETQTELGLEGAYADDGLPQDDEERRTLEAKRRMARMRGEPDPVQAAALSASPRRELLPDIEEINSSLRSDTDRGRADRDNVGSLSKRDDTKRKGGFRRGFLLIFVLFVIFALIYVYAPEIAAQVPQADPYLSSYVAWVDNMRVWLDGQVKYVLTWLDTMASQASN